MPIEILPKRIYVTTHINTGRGLIKGERYLSHGSNNLNPYSKSCLVKERICEKLL